jgi:hypothetical protein
MATIQEAQYDEDKEKEQAAKQLSTGVATGATGLGPSAPSGGLGQPQRTKAGTGQAFNIRRYAEANPLAGQRLAERLGQQAQQAVAPQKQEVETGAESFRAGVQQAQQQVAQTGQQLQQQLQQPDFSAQQFTQDPGRFGQFQKFLGRGEEQDYFQADPFQQQQQQLQMQQEQAQQAYGEQIGRLGTEQGRFGLLGEYLQTAGIDTSKYDPSKFRISQALIQQSPEAIAQQQQALQEQQTQLAGLTPELQQLGQQLGQIGEEEATLQQQLQQRTEELRGQFYDPTAGTGSLAEQLAARKQTVEQARGAEQEGIQLALDVLGGRKFEPDLSSRETGLMQRGFQRLGLDRGMDVAGLQSTFESLSPQEVLAVQAGGLDPSQFITGEEAARAQALARLAGVDPATQAGQFAEGVGPEAIERALQFRPELIQERKQAAQTKLIEDVGQMGLRGELTSAPKVRGREVDQFGQERSREYRAVAAVDTDLVTRALQEGKSVDEILATPGIIKQVGDTNMNEAAGQIAEADAEARTKLRQALQGAQYGETLQDYLKRRATEAAAKAPDAATRARLETAYQPISAEGGLGQVTPEMERREMAQAQELRRIDEQIASGMMRPEDAQIRKEGIMMEVGGKRFTDPAEYIQADIAATPMSQIGAGTFGVPQMGKQFDYRKYGHHLEQMDPNQRAAIIGPLAAQGIKMTPQVLNDMHRWVNQQNAELDKQPVFFQGGQQKRYAVDMNSGTIALR